MTLALSSLDTFDSALNTQFIPGGSLSSLTVQAALLELDSNIAALTNGGTGRPVLGVPDMMDESDPVYFYFGWLTVNSGWLIQRQTRATSQSKSTNSGYPNLNTAWVDRASLTYT